MDVRTAIRTFLISLLMLCADLTMSTVHTGQLRRPIPLLPIQYPRPNPPPLHLLRLQIPLYILPPHHPLQNIRFTETPPPILHPLLPPPHLRPTRHLRLLRTRNPKRELCTGHVSPSDRVSKRKGNGKDGSGRNVDV